MARVSRKCSVPDCTEPIAVGQTWCRPHATEYARLRGLTEKGRAGRRRYKLKAAYGVTPEQVAACFEDQGRVCAVCGTDTPGHRGWVVDHSHKTQDFRGVLCTNCNWLLGNAKDSVEILLAAVAYLETHDAANR